MDKTLLNFFPRNFSHYVLPFHITLHVYFASFVNGKHTVSDIFVSKLLYVRWKCTVQDCELKDSKHSPNLSCCSLFRQNISGLSHLFPKILILPHFRTNF